jgi:hypothetical protein
MSMTSERSTSFTARAEYFFDESANTWKLAKLNIGNPIVAAVAPSADFNTLRRPTIRLVWSVIDFPPD